MPQASMVMEKAVGMVIFSVPAWPPGHSSNPHSAPVPHAQKYSLLDLVPLKFMLHRWLFPSLYGRTL